MIMVLDATGDIATENITTGMAPDLTGVVTTTPSTCFGGFGGTITVSSTNVPLIAPFSLEVLTPGGTVILSSNSIPTVWTNQSAAYYEISVHDAAGCVGNLTTTVESGDTIHTTATVHSPSCTGATDAFITFAVDNGIGPWYVNDVPPGPATIYGFTNGTPSDAIGVPNPGTYYLQVEDTVVGCLGWVTVVIPDGPPAVTHAGYDTLVCTASAVQLSGSANGSLQNEQFSWSPATGLSNANIANPIATPATTTTYILTTSTGSSACISSDAITITVVDVQIPILTFIYPTLSISNPQASVSYTWQQFNNGTWNDIAAGTSYTVMTDGEYRVKATSGQCVVYSASQTSFSRISPNPFGISLFPNPTTDVLKLDDLKLEDNWLTLDIINSQGLKVMSTTSIRNKINFSTNISRLSIGIYIVKLTKADGGTAEIRFIKN